MASKTCKLQNPMLVYDFRTQDYLPWHVFSRDDVEHRLEYFSELLSFPSEFDGADGCQLVPVETETDGLGSWWYRQVNAKRMESLFGDEAGTLIPGVKYHTSVDVGSGVWVEDADILHIRVLKYLSDFSIFTFPSRADTNLLFLGVEEVELLSLSSGSSNQSFYLSFFEESSDGSGSPCWLSLFGSSEI